MNTPLNQRATAIEFVNTSEEPWHLKGTLYVEPVTDYPDIEDVVFKRLLPRPGAEKKSIKYTYTLGPRENFLNKGGGFEFPATSPLIYHFTCDNEGEDVPFSQPYLIVTLTAELDGESVEFLYARKELIPKHHLLPPNATPLEQALGKLTTRLESLPVPIKRLWRPEQCPPDALSYLAWGLSVDMWPSFNRSRKQEEMEAKRRSVAKSFAWHCAKGTIGAVKAVLDNLGLGYIITEWPHPSDLGTGKPAYQANPYYFEIQINLDDSKFVDVTMDKKLRQMIDAVKPLRSHYRFVRGFKKPLEIVLTPRIQGIPMKHFNLSVCVPHPGPS